MNGDIDTHGDPVGHAEQKREDLLVDIGKEEKPYVIEPLVEPVPGREPSPAPPEPEYRPDLVPEREREGVPA